MQIKKRELIWEWFRVFNELCNEFPDSKYILGDFTHYVFLVPELLYSIVCMYLRVGRALRI